MDEDRSIRLKWSVLGILGIVYSSIGAFMILLSIAFIFIPDKEARIVSMSVTGGMGVFWLLLGSIFLSVELRKRKKVKDAFLNGRKVFAQYDHSQINYYVKKNLRHPFNVYCRWIDENQQIHFFKSMDIDFNPDMLLQGKMIPVYVNPDDYNAYYVDLDCVLPMESIHTHIL